jgi:hypothetical protein
MEKQVNFKIMDKVIVRIYQNRFWSIGEVYKNNVLIAEINRHYEVDENFIYIYDSVGGSGTGYKKGELLQKISIANCEYKKETINEINLKYENNYTNTESSRRYIIL